MTHLQQSYHLYRQQHFLCCHRWNPMHNTIDNIHLDLCFVNLIDAEKYFVVNS